MVQGPGGEKLYPRVGTVGVIDHVDIVWVVWVIWPAGSVEVTIATRCSPDWLNEVG